MIDRAVWGAAALRGPFFGQDEGAAFHPEPLSVLHLRSAAQRLGLHLGRRVARQLSAPLLHQILRLMICYEERRFLFILAKKRTARRWPHMERQGEQTT